MSLLLIGLAVGLIVLTEVRMERLRWLLAEAALRISKLESLTAELKTEIATLRDQGPLAPRAEPAQPEHEPPKPEATEAPKLAPAADSLAPVAPLTSADATAASGPATLEGGGSVPPMTPPVSGLPSPSPPSPPAASLEERLGTRWAVWVGGIALALGGVLLVRYSIEQGYFGPGARIVMGILFAMALLGAGEWFRRTGEHPSLEALPQAHIPSVLTAAGSMSLFATIYAAYALYEFIGSATAFVLLGAVGVGTMFAAALHGPMLAGLGLAGAYGAPLLISSARPSPWPLVIYVLVVAAAAMSLARLRQWLWLASVAVAGAFVWGLLFLKPIAFGDMDWTLAGYLHTLLQLGLAGSILAVLPNLGAHDRDADPEPVGSLALTALAVLAMVMLGTAHVQTSSAVPFTLAAMALLSVCAWVAPRVAVGTVLSGIVLLVTVVVWPGLRATDDTSHLLREVAGVLLVPENVVSYLMFTALASFAVTAVGALRLMRGAALPQTSAALFALAATATPLLALILTYLRVTQFDTSISFAFAAGVLACVFAVLAERFLRNEVDELPGTRLATGAFAAASIAALSLGLIAALSRGYLTVALSLAALGTAFVATRKDIPLLRHVVSALAVVVLARIAWDPRIMGDGVGTTPVFNWLLIGYGIPAVAFYKAARLLESRNARVPAGLADATAILLTGLLFFFQIRHALNAGDIMASDSSHVEMGLFALVGFGMSYALMRMDLGRANPVFRAGSMVIGVLGGLVVVCGLGLLQNPLFNHDPIKGPAVLSSLLLAYLLPGLAAVMLARAARPHRPGWYVTGIAVLAVLLIFGYVTLEVRHAFQGPYIEVWRGRSTGPEMWAYSAAWLWLGLVFLAYGIFRGNLEARIASAALVMLTVVKVFIFDLAGITGLWRAMSFIVLGLVLIGIGLAYQHLVFGNRRPPVTPAPEAPPAA